MIKCFILFLTFTLFSTFSQAEPELPTDLKCKKDLCVKAMKVDEDNDGDSDKVYIFIKNQKHYPLQYSFKFKTKNLFRNFKLPKIGNLEAYDTKLLVILSERDSAKPWNYNYTFKFYMGAVSHHKKNTAYRLPYKKGKAFKVIQGYDSQFTHHGKSKYALDWEMPEGTKVYAARQGIVRFVKEDSRVGGPNKRFLDKANIVSILHDDGSIAMYVHLKHNGALVKAGDRVKEGQLIALSGNTGFSTKPHLHFHVVSFYKFNVWKNVPTKFRTENGLEILEEGKTYKAK